MSQDPSIEALQRAFQNIDFAKLVKESMASNAVAESNPESPTLNSTPNAEVFDDSFFAKYADEYIEFTYKNPTIYHVVKYFSDKLKAQGFEYLSEKDSWTDVKPGKYFTSRNGSSLIAFTIGKNWKPSKGLGVIGSHIDSLTVALKPSSIKNKVDGYDLLGVAPYAGTLSDVWWDRDLGIGGRLIVKKDNQVTSTLVDSSPHPIAHIPTLAPHFGAPAVGPFNKETQAVPVIGFSSEPDIPATESEKKAPLYGKHPIKLLRYISKISNTPIEDILQWDLQLFDVQKGALGGLDNEFIFAPRIDDRVCSFAAIYSLLEADKKNLLPDDNFSIVGLFDHEEIGSGSRTGIRGQLFESTVSRVVSSDYYNPNLSDISDALAIAYANTIILSADVNHLVNPNFTGYYLENHKPVPNKGVTIAFDTNGHFATDSLGTSLLEELARLNDDQLQYFHIRNDSRSGGSIGPLISLQTGARTIDLGIPQLSMHSIRATVGSKDIGNGIKFFSGFFKNWRKTYDTYQDL